MQVLRRLEARRHQVPEAEVAAVERQMEEVRENIWKAEVRPTCAQAALKLHHPMGVELCWNAVLWSSHPGDWVWGERGEAGLSPTP